jgi:hypothetical protein
VICEELPVVGSAARPKHQYPEDFVGPQLPMCEQCSNVFNPWHPDSEQGQYHESREWMSQDGEFEMWGRTEHVFRPHEFCSQECEDEAREDTIDGWRDGGREYDSDESDRFADPGGNSALYAESDDDPRIHPCPNCEAPNKLTGRDVAAGYQCDSCADKAERGVD